MKKVTLFSAIVGIIMLFAVNANAASLTGIATLDGFTTQVGLTNAAGDKIIYYIPLGGTVNVSGVYGDGFDADGHILQVLLTFLCRYDNFLKR